jgi:hypothetical protein
MIAEPQCDIEVVPVMGFRTILKIAQPSRIPTRSLPRKLQRSEEHTFLLFEI